MGMRRSYRNANVVDLNQMSSHYISATRREIFTPDVLRECDARALEVCLRPEALRHLGSHRREALRHLGSHRREKPSAISARTAEKPSPISDRTAAMSVDI
jgi:hypothetical protein